jgi:hypothetical protein
VAAPAGPALLPQLAAKGHDTKKRTILILLKNL